MTARPVAEGDGQADPVVAGARDPGGPAAAIVSIEPTHLRPWAMRMRRTGAGGRAAILRLRRWLSTPSGRRVLRTASRGLAAGLVLWGAATVLERILAAGRTRWGALSGPVRRVVRAAGGLAGWVRREAGPGWVGRILALLAAPLRPVGHVHCEDCRARMRADASVCWRCGCRASGTRARRGVSVWLGRTLTGRLRPRCAACRRRLHPDARRCHRCGTRRDGPRRRRVALLSR